MAIPLIIAGAAGLLGLGGHLSAKETNEMAQRVSQEAQSMYYSAKVALETEKKITEQALLKLGSSKKRIMDSSIDRFLKAYDRIKDVQLSDSVGLNELSRFSIDKQDTIELQKMSDIYSSSISSGAAGAAAGAVIALAASGSLPIVTGTLSIAGSALAMGEIGMAAELAGSALSFGAVMTPLSAIAAPVVLFTGISASMKADENLEKANVMRAEAEEACEKMAVAQNLCIAIKDRSNMYDKLLYDLDSMYGTCTVLLDQVTRKKVKKAHRKTLTSADFTAEELKLIAVTRALTAAVKAVIDTPILSENGNISSKSQSVYNSTMKALPSFSSQVDEVKSYNYHTSILPSCSLAAKATAIAEESAPQQGNRLLTSTRNVFALCIGLFLGCGFIGTLWDFALSSSIIILLLMNIKTPSKFFGWVKTVCCAAIGISFGGMFWLDGVSLIYADYFLIKAIGIGILSLVVFCLFFAGYNTSTGNIKRMIIRISGCAFCSCIALLLLSLCYEFSGLPFTLVMVLLEILYVPCALFCTFFPELYENT